MRKSVWCLMVAVSAAAQRFDAGPAWKLTPASGAYHRFLAPGEAFEVAVELRDAAGSPVTGAAITFILPESGYGSFTGEGERPWLRRVLVSDSGSASAAMVAPDRESFYTVSAVADGSTQEVTIAVTVLPDRPSPGWDAGDARFAAAERFGTMPDSPGLFGPYWLPAGSRFGPANRLDTSTTVLSASYFFWYDPTPHADFFHSGRSLAVDGSARPAALPDPGGASWWPTIRTADGAGQSRLLRALVDGSSLTHPRDASFEPARQSPPITHVSRGPMAEEAPQGACGLIAYGPGRSFYVNSLNMKDVFENTLKISPDRMLTSPNVTLPSDFDKMIEQAVALRCTKLYIYLAGHGSGGALFLGNENDQDNDSGADTVLYSTIAAQLQLATARLKREGVDLEVCMIVQSCGAGSMIPALQGKGFNGEVVTASDDSSSAYGFPIGVGSLFTYNLAKCWQSGQADLNGDGKTTLAELKECVDGRFLPNFALLGELLVNTLPNPQSSPIFGAGLFMSAPPVTVERGSARTVTIPRPEWAVGALEVRVESSNPAIATVNGRDFVNLDILPESSNITITINGVSAGQASYTVRILRDAQGKTAGATSTITVTAPISLGPASGAGPLLDLGNSGAAAARVSRTGSLSNPLTLLLRTEADTPGTGDVAFVPYSVTIPANVASANFNVFGLRPGRTSIIASSGTDSWRMPVLMPGTGFTGPVRLNLGTPGQASACDWSNNPFVGDWQAQVAPDAAVIAPNGGQVRDPRQIGALGCTDLGTLSISPRESGGVLVRFRSLPQGGASRDHYSGIVTNNSLVDGPPAGLAIAAPPSFREAGSRYSLDLAAANASGAFVRNTRFFFNANQCRLFIGGVPLNPNGEATVEAPAGPNGFLRLDWVVPQPGPASILIRTTPNGPPATIPLDSVARLAEPADYLNLLNRPEPIPAGQTGGVDFEVRRGGTPLDRAVMTCSVEGGVFEFTGGTLGRRNTLTQYTLGNSGRIRVPIRANRTGFGILSCFTGQLFKDVLIRTPFPGE